jgi:hypothetical protein
MSDKEPMALFVVPAEVRADQSFNTSYRLTQEQKIDALYRPTTLVMAFASLEELDFFRQVLKGQG